jgi:hypothetical protein
MKVKHIHTSLQNIKNMLRYIFQIFEINHLYQWIN